MNISTSEHGWIHADSELCQLDGTPFPKLQGVAEFTPQVQILILKWKYSADQIYKRFCMMIILLNTCAAFKKKQLEQIYNGSIKIKIL